MSHAGWSGLQRDRRSRHPTPGEVEHDQTQLGAGVDVVVEAPPAPSPDAPEPRRSCSREHLRRMTAAGASGRGALSPSAPPAPGAGTDRRVRDPAARRARRGARALSPGRKREAGRQIPQRPAADRQRARGVGGGTGSLPRQARRGHRALDTSACPEARAGQRFGGRCATGQGTGVRRHRAGSRTGRRRTPLCTP